MLMRALEVEAEQACAIPAQFGGTSRPRTMGVEKSDAGFDEYQPLALGDASRSCLSLQLMDASDPVLWQAARLRGLKRPGVTIWGRSQLDGILIESGMSAVIGLE